MVNALVNGDAFAISPATPSTCISSLKVGPPPPPEPPPSAPEVHPSGPSSNPMLTVAPPLRTRFNVTSAGGETPIAVVKAASLTQFATAPAAGGQPPAKALAVKVT